MMEASSWVGFCIRERSCATVKYASDSAFMTLNVRSLMQRHRKWQLLFVRLLSTQAYCFLKYLQTLADNIYKGTLSLFELPVYQKKHIRYCILISNKNEIVQS